MVLTVVQPRAPTVISRSASAEKCTRGSSRSALTTSAALDGNLPFLERWTHVGMGKLEITNAEASVGRFTLARFIEGLNYK